MILSYEILTDAVLSLRRFHSLKAIVVLNSIEFIFWVAAIAISIIGLKGGCEGMVCDVQGVSIVFVTILL